MKETLRALYNQEVERARLDFDGDRDYQAYYTQSQALWKEGDMPEPFFHLLDASNYLAFSHGFRLGMLEAFSLPGGREVPPPRRHRRRKVHCTRNSLAGIARYVPLLLLSKPDPLRWAPVWVRPSADFRAQPRGAAVIRPYPSSGKTLISSASQIRKNCSKEGFFLPRSISLKNVCVIPNRLANWCWLKPRASRFRFRISR